jgi:hypothetical protein
VWIYEHIWTHSRLSEGHVLLQMRYGTVGCEIGRGEREKQRERNREKGLKKDYDLKVLQ